jgi:mercuric ion transport protein
MTDRSLIATGNIAAVLAAICCATPLLAVVLGGIGLTVWIAKADYVVLPVLLLWVALVGFGLYRRQLGTACAAKDDPRLHLGKRGTLCLGRSRPRCALSHALTLPPGTCWRDISQPLFFGLVAREPKHSLSLPPTIAARPWVIPCRGPKHRSGGLNCPVLSLAMRL